MVAGVPSSVAEGTEKVVSRPRGGEKNEEGRRTAALVFLLRSFMRRKTRPSESGRKERRSAWEGRSRRGLESEELTRRKNEKESDADVSPAVDVLGEVESSEVVRSFRIDTVRALVGRVLRERI